MKAYGVDVSSMKKWDEMAASYSRNIANNYHHHRLAVIDSLIPDDLLESGKSVFDFGCGDAVLFEKFLSKGCSIQGCDISNEMIILARQRLERLGVAPDLASVGDVRTLESLETDILDAILCFNVLAYLTDEEEEIFYRQAHRIIKPGGYLIVTHSNELFDMYSLNNYTSAFYSKYFVAPEFHHEILRLIPEASECASSERITYNIRENPLAYRFKLCKYGFSEQRQEFINLHIAPPPLLEQEKSYPDTLFWKDEERWKLMFICSTFGSLSTKC